VEAEGLVPIRITPHQPDPAVAHALAGGCGATGGGGSSRAEAPGFGRPRSRRPLVLLLVHVYGICLFIYL